MFTFIATLLLAFTAVFASPLETIIRSGSGPFSYDPDSGIGPADWGSIEGFETCGTGNKQSPINVRPRIGIAKISKGPQPKLKETELKFKRTVENFELDCEKEATCGFTKLGGERFNLVNAHFHSNSEHKLFGVQFPLESHFVHASESRELLVIGTFYKIVDDDDDADDDEGGSKGNPVLEEILDQIEAGKTEITVNLPRLIGRLGYIGYSGSLTTPPCSEDVNWFIALTIQPVSKKQVKRYRAIAGSGSFGNNRPIQPLNRRKLTAFIKRKH